jgi:hypothetical protein
VILKVLEGVKLGLVSALLWMLATLCLAGLGKAVASDYSERDFRRREVVALEKIAASLQKMERCK